MTRNRLLAILLVLALSIGLAGCEVPAPGTPLPTVTPPPTDTPTLAPSATPSDTAVPVDPTDTPIPPTETDTPMAPTETETPPPTTETPVTAAPTVTLTPTSAMLWPQAPDEFNVYAETILDYLNADPVHIIRLRPMLRDWGALTDRLGEVQEADVDTDGDLEWVIALAAPARATLNVPGDLLVIDRQDGTYSLAFQSSVEFDALQENVAILAVKDINADGRPEIAYTSMSCGAHTCLTTVHILGWDEEAFRLLTQNEVIMPYADVKLENRDDDVALELVLHGGMIGSVGAGPQRARTEVYNWNGTYYVLSDTIHDESDFLYFKVLDANAALKAGDYTRAISLYQEAIENTDLRTWKGPEERPDLVAFSRFRLALTYLLVKDEANADAMAQALQSQQPDHVYNQVTQVLLDYYTKEDTVTAACQAVTEFVYEHPEAVEVLNGFGYANPTFAPEQVCPIGVSAP